MNLATAQHYADKLLAWIQPYVDRADLAGSIRRQRAVCNDVDIVCIPQIKEERDLFGAVVARTNRLHQFLGEYVEDSDGRATFQSGGDTPGKCVIIQLPKCQLDLWFATQDTFATRMLCRTGSKEHNIWLASRAKARGWKWNPYEGLIMGGLWINDDYVGGDMHRLYTEEGIYAALGLPFIEPQHREIDVLIHRFGP